MQINRKYFKQSNTVYVFPVGFIRDNDVFDKEFMERYNTWYSIVLTENIDRPIGIKNNDNSVTSYQYFLNYEIPSTAVYITDSNILGGL